MILGRAGTVCPFMEQRIVQGAEIWRGGAWRREDILVADGRIVQVAAKLDEPAGCVVRDAAGLRVLPGLVDCHVHFRDPGLAEKEGWPSGSAGALFGGATTVLEIQNNEPLTRDASALAARQDHVAGRSLCDYGLYPNLLADNLDELAGMADGAVAFKCFMGCSTGGIGWPDDGPSLTEAFTAAAAAGRPVVVHAEDQVLLAQGSAAHGSGTAATHHLARPAEAEIRAVDAAIEAAVASGARLHVFHVATAGGADLIRQARANDLAVGASTAPHYLLLSCHDAERLGNLLKVNPAIQTPADREALLAAVGDGTIASVGTDHAPHPLSEKQRDYADAPAGMPGADLLWPLMAHLVERGDLSEAAAIGSVTSAPADEFRLAAKGAIETGRDADLVFVASDRRMTVAAADLPSKSEWSCWEGLDLPAPPVEVWLRGERVSPESEARGRPVQVDR